VNIGTYIWQRRMELGMAQKALAEVLGISASYLSDIEHGNRGVTVELIARCAEALKVDSDILYFHAGLLAPDMYAIPFSGERICAAFAAMRAALVRQRKEDEAG